MFPTFAAEAAYLDIEIDGLGEITAVGLLDGGGPRIFLAGRDLDRFPEAARGHSLLVTFNGLSFDVPILRRAFPHWEPPIAHVDLRHLWARLGFHGGLKSIERRVGLGRPDHLAALDGWQAVWLWRRAQQGDHAALRLFAEYNLYDTVNLRTLMGLGYNRMAAALGFPEQQVSVSWRGDVLYDVSKALLGIGPM